MGMITIKISDELDNEIADFLKKTKISKDKFVEEALQKYLKIKRFRELMQKKTKGTFLTN
jgi:metal-responsive CopG/Arc/MetJ family transcriptional regulator